MRGAIKLVLVFIVFTMTGCGASGVDELRQWMAEQKNQTRPRVKAVAEPKQFKPESYNQVTAIEPFNNQKLTLALKTESSQAVFNGGLIAPELARRKQALEAFPLDTMALVGTLTKDGQPMALLKVDNLLYQVRPGNYLGQNYGRVTKITETEVALREIVQDAVGEWIERAATLQLQERLK